MVSSGAMRPFPLALSLAAVIFPALAAPAPAADPRPFSVQDLVTLQRVSDPQPSPDGRWIAYVLRSTDLEANRGRTDLWMVGIDGKGARRLVIDEDHPGHAKLICTHTEGITPDGFLKRHRHHTASRKLVEVSF